MPDNQYTAQRKTIESLRAQLKSEQVGHECTRQERDAYKARVGAMYRVANTDLLTELSALIKAGHAMTDDLHCQRFWQYVLGRIGNIKQEDTTNA